MYAFNRPDLQNLLMFPRHYQKTRPSISTGKTLKHSTKQSVEILKSLEETKAEPSV